MKLPSQKREVIMLSLVKSIVDAVFSMVLAIGIAGIGINSFYNWIRKEAITKIHQGLPSMSRISEQLTCMKFNEKMQHVPSYKGKCRDYHRRKNLR
jgi:hypothetical protein